MCECLHTWIIMVALWQVNPTVFWRIDLRTWARGCASTPELDDGAIITILLIGRSMDQLFNSHLSKNPRVIWSIESIKCIILRLWSWTIWHDHRSRHFSAFPFFSIDVRGFSLGRWCAHHWVFQMHAGHAQREFNRGGCTSFAAELTRTVEMRISAWRVTCARQWKTDELRINCNA